MGVGPAGMGSRRGLGQSRAGLCLLLASLQLLPRTQAGEPGGRAEGAEGRAQRGAPRRGGAGKGEACSLRVAATVCDCPARLSDCDSWAGGEETRDRVLLVGAGERMQCISVQDALCSHGCLATWRETVCALESES